MHPSLAGAFIDESVDALRSCLAARTDLGHIEVHLESDHSAMLVLFDHTEIPTETVRVASPLLGPDGQPIVKLSQVPNLRRPANVRRLGILLDLDAYDLVPPTALLVDEDRAPLPDDAWPTSFDGGGIVPKHPHYGRPFFCRPGFREYHTHPQHEDDPWALWREALPLQVLVVGLLDGLRNRWHSVA